MNSELRKSLTVLTTSILFYRTATSGNCSVTREWCGIWRSITTTFSQNSKSLLNTKLLQHD